MAEHSFGSDKKCELDEAKCACKEMIIKWRKSSLLGAVNMRM